MNDLAECHSLGEALVVEMKPGDPLFILISNGLSSTSDAEAILAPVTGDPLGVSNADLPDKWHLQLNNVPTMVHFTQLNDPLSVEQVAPQDLARTFGLDTKLVSFDAEKTNASITYGRVKPVLPWIGGSKNLFWIGNYSANPPHSSISQMLDQYDFVSMNRKP